MSDRIDELVDTTSVAVLNISSREEKDAGYAAIRELATIAREAEARALKWREAAFYVAYAWWEQDEDSATDYLLERGWDIDELSFEALVEDVRQQPHPTALEAAREAVTRDER